MHACMDLLFPPCSLPFPHVEESSPLGVLWNFGQTCRHWSGTSIKERVCKWEEEAETFAQLDNFQCTEEWTIRDSTFKRAYEDRQKYFMGIYFTRGLSCCVLPCDWWWRLFTLYPAKSALILHTKTWTLNLWLCNLLSYTLQFVYFSLKQSLQRTMHSLFVPLGAWPFISPKFHLNCGKCL